MQNEYLSSFDNLSEIVIIEDKEGVIKYVNKAFCQCHGVSVEEAVGRSCFDFIIPEDRETCMMHNVVTPETANYKIEGRSKRVDGKIIWIQYVGKAFFSEDGELLEFQELGVDITQWKEKIDEKARALEKANEQLNASKSVIGGKAVRQPKKGNYGNVALFKFSDIITSSGKMIAQKSYAQAVAQGECSVLIEGESGTGKEMFAQAIHNSSKRANGPFVAVNCGAIPAELVSSEFFGYEDGAFTGAAKGGKAGKFEQASGGTLFLDEIGEMPLAQQVALLRVLETKSVTRVGGSTEIPIDIRIVCATNKNLLEESNKNNFRRDLYYRLNIINLKIPPLRERKDDIFLLIGYFIKRSGNSEFLKKKAFSDDQLIKLYHYDWPGNVRELQNVVERMRFRPEETVDEIIENNRKLIEAEAKQMQEKALPEVTRLEPAEVAVSVPGEKEEILEKLSLYEGNVSMVARKMGISRKTLYKKLNKYGIKTK
ncbi:MAG: sigma 54-interacting transcriptional regulator [Anaerovoracaceae bacterium]